MSTASWQPQDRRWLLLLLVLATLTVYRAAIACHLPLFFDEAQYWTWSRQLDWGYFSKPPMVAWIIRAFAVFGDSELTVRLGTLLLHPITAGLVYVIGRRMFGAAAALLAALLFISLPLVGFNSLFMTTDAPLFLCWGLAVLGLWNAFERNAWRDWVLAGGAAGLGMLSKYSMATFLPSAVLALCLPAYRRHWRNPRLYLAAALALLLFAPNLWWNAHSDFVSFRHTADISQWDRALFHPARLAEFLGAQFLCMGPLAFAALLAELATPSTWRDPRCGFLAAMTLPFLLLIGAQALLARANPNWAAPAYVGGALLVAARWSTRQRARSGLAALAILTNLLFLSAFYHYRELASLAGIELTRKTDPYARLRGWPQAGQAVAALLARHPGARLAVRTRDEFALLSYYTREPDRVAIWNPQHGRTNHYQLVADAAQLPGATLMFATREPLGDAPAAAFTRWTALGTVAVPLYRDESLTLHLYLGHCFKGY
ncbi:MAG TPA: glycosyltransferase family 39 protein [Burkholderiaceae bacterium]|nr:glycosyltransferase family 39 protein [Burkholderiaceae bacterium]